MLSLKNYLLQPKQAVGWLTNVNNHQSVLLAPGTYCPPHAGQRRVFEQLAVKAQQLKAKPIIVVIDLDEVQPDRPLTGIQRKKWISKIDSCCSDIVIGEHVYDVLHTMLHKIKMLPVGDIMGIPNRSDNPYIDGLTKILGEGHPAIDQYISYAITPRQGSLLYEGQVPLTHQLSASYIRGLVKNDKKELFELLYKDIGLKTEEIRELYIEIAQGMITGDVNLLARGRVS